MAKVYGNRWEMVRPLGEGGQAHTYLVKDLKGTAEIVYVLKRLRDVNRLDRFKREVEAIRNLTHENILRLVDFDLEAEKPYLVSEFCSGGSLSEADPFWRESPVKALTLFQQICTGVAYAHSHEIVHRDLKPDNIFLRTKEGPAVVGDFGICYLVDEGIRLTSTDRAVGARLFMAPELEDGRDVEVSDKSDTYSLGKVLYWLMTGRVFSREKHREQRWDLKRYNEDALLNWDNIYMEHVNRLLDVMIVPERDKRRSVRGILRLLPRVSRLVEKEYTPIAPGIPQPCTYCGVGRYVTRAADDDQVRSFGFTPVSNSNWRILTCNMCGHVQSFRIDHADMRHWWEDQID